VEIWIGSPLIKTTLTPHVPVRPLDGWTTPPPLRRVARAPGRRKTSRVPRESVQAVLQDLEQFLNDSIAAHAFACAGLRQVSALFERVPRVAENPDPLIHIGTGDPNAPETRFYARWRVSDALSQVDHDGPVEARLGQQWIVYVFTGWEHEYRPRLAAAHGSTKELLLYPLLGDLRRLRNDVVHHHGIASADNAGKCEIVQHWVAVGDVIQLKGEHFVEFVTLFPWTEMHAGPQ
jgi:hypothetical protein